MVLMVVGACPWASISLMLYMCSMLSNAFTCFFIYSHCFSLLFNALLCFAMLLSVFNALQCFSILPNAFLCFPLIFNAFDGFYMFLASLLCREESPLHREEKFLLCTSSCERGGKMATSARPSFPSGSISIPS